MTGLWPWWSRTEACGTSAHPAGGERVLARVDFPRPSGRGSGGCVGRHPRRQPGRSVCRGNPKWYPGGRVRGLWQVVAPLAGNRRWHAVVRLGIARHAQRQARQRANAGGTPGRPAELFAVTDDGHVWHRMLRTATDPSSWSPWVPLPATGPAPGATRLRCDGGRYRPAGRDRRRPATRYGTRHRPLPMRTPGRPGPNWRQCQVRLARLTGKSWASQRSASTTPGS